MKRRGFGVAVGVALTLAVGCTKKPVPVEAEKDYTKPLPPGKMALVKITDPSQIPDFRPTFANLSGVVQAIDYSLDYLAHPSSRGFFPYLDISHERAVESLKAFRKLALEATSPEELQARIVRDFDVYRTVGCDNNGLVLFTGYCQPIYDGSLQRTDVFRYPLYKKPADLLKDETTGKCLGRKTPEGQTVRYWTRKEIETQGLLKGQELVWLKDRLEAYIVHVQGSAKLRLPDGRLYEIGYAAKNDAPYVSLGKELVADGKIARRDLSLRAIKEYFAKHPEELEGYLYRNPSYIFFMERTGGPFGSLGQPVTPYRSLATDKEVYPRACVVCVMTQVPRRQSDGRIAMTGFTQWMCDQDTGGAIRAAGRADIFMGTGPEAEELAGRTEAEGTLYYVFLKGGPSTAPAEASTAPPAPRASPLDR